MDCEEIIPHACEIIPIGQHVTIAEAAACSMADQLLRKYHLIECLRLEAQIEGDRIRAKIAREMATTARREWLAALREPMQLHVAKKAAGGR